MMRILTILSVIFLASCTDAGNSAGVAGPTGRARDSRNMSPIQVRDVWKSDLQPRTQKIVVSQLPLGKTARFDEHVHFDGFYDSNRDVTSIGVYGNVTTSTDYGTVRTNGYYALWEQNGRITTDFPYAPWKLADLEITDELY
jgi:hypothetical protein